jgi:hypothetical protein
MSSAEPARGREEDMNVRETVSRLRRIDVPTDPDARERLVAGGLVLGGLVLGRVFHRRFRLLAFGAGCWLAASAMRERPVAVEEEIVDELEFEDEPVDTPVIGFPAVAALGVPHRLPEEIVRRREEPERPAPSPEGELGLSD